MLLDFDSKVLQPSDDPYAQGAFACSSTSSPVASPTVSTSQSPPLSSLPPSPAPATGSPPPIITTAQAISTFSTFPMNPYRAELWYWGTPAMAGGGLLGVVSHWSWWLQPIADGADWRMQLALSSGFTASSAPFTLSRTRFHHLAFVLDAQGAQFFVDDVTSGTASAWPSAALPGSSQDLLFLGGWSPTTPALDGALDEIRIYSALPLSLRSGFSLTDDLVQQYCDPERFVLCGGHCTAQCPPGFVLGTDCACRCSVGQEECGGTCVPVCPDTSFLRDGNCTCLCPAASVAVWIIRYLTLSSPVAADSPGNYFADNMYALYYGNTCSLACLLACLSV